MSGTKFSGIIIATGSDNSGQEADPMVMLGTTTAVKRLVLTYQQAGISPIIVVTGFNGLDVERHLAMYEVIFYHNDRREVHDFEDDVLPAIIYAAKKADKVIISSVDYPLFSTSTVRMLEQTEGGLCIPRYSGENGYPLVVESSMCDGIKAQAGQTDWIKCIMDAFPSPVFVDTADRGVTLKVGEADCLDEIVNEHDKQLLHPYVRLDIDCPTKIFDARMKMLLTLIDDTKTVKTACMMTAISVGKAWGMINILENALGFQVVKRRQGGSRGGNTELTEQGREYLRKYEKLEENVRRYADEEFEKLFSDDPK